eukprot:scaffold533_cov369-Prasinococcus_capsulatus_cf.AAC.29
MGCHAPLAPAPAPNSNRRLGAPFGARRRAPSREGTKWRGARARALTPTGERLLPPRRFPQAAPCDPALAPVWRPGRCCAPPSVAPSGPTRCPCAGGAGGPAPSLVSAAPEVNQPRLALAVGSAARAARCALCRSPLDYKDRRGRGPCLQCEQTDRHVPSALQVLSQKTGRLPELPCRLALFARACPSSSQMSH